MEKDLDYVLHMPTVTRSPLFRISRQIHQEVSAETSQARVHQRLKSIHSNNIHISLETFRLIILMALAANSKFFWASCRLLQPVLLDKAL